MGILKFVWDSISLTCVYFSTAWACGLSIAYYTGNESVYYLFYRSLIMFPIFGVLSAIALWLVRRRGV